LSPSHTQSASASPLLRAPLLLTLELSAVAKTLDVGPLERGRRAGRLAGGAARRRGARAPVFDAIIIEPRGEEITRWRVFFSPPGSTERSDERALRRERERARGREKRRKMERREAFAVAKRTKQEGVSAGEVVQSYVTIRRAKREEKIERALAVATDSSFPSASSVVPLSLSLLSLMAPKDDPALGERDVAAANGGDAADGIADAEAVRFFPSFRRLHFDRPAAALQLSLLSHPALVPILQNFSPTGARGHEGQAGGDGGRRGQAEGRGGER
jgi:hypothetical protein